MMNTSIHSIVKKGDKRRATMEALLNEFLFFNLFFVTCMKTGSRRYRGECAK
jgi:hypothetical protein